jgi:hypothetical protein
MRRPGLRRFARRTAIAVLVASCCALIAVVVFTARCHSSPTQPLPVSEAAAARKKITANIKDYSRPQEDTFLTYPEWYIVWSYQEKADYQQNHLPSGFPYFSAIKQYWSGYCCAYGITRGKYPFNIGDHVMLAVIGTSFSFEYALKGAYENTVGRFTEWLSSGDPAEEDRYAARVAKEYADFVHIRPFYEFSFWRRFKGLWTGTSAWGPHAIRKWERKSFLTVDYLFESFYCWLIEQATHATYGVETADTHAWIDNAPSDLFGKDSRVRLVKAIGPRSCIAILPRYQEFTTVASQLAARGVHFVEIAGNEEVLFTTLAAAEWTYPGEVLFSSPILTQPALKRIAVRVPVASLHTVLGVGPVEHIYDF